MLRSVLFDLDWPWIGRGLDYDLHFESAAMNGACFQDQIGFIKFSISPEFVPLLIEKTCYTRFSYQYVG